MNSKINITEEIKVLLTRSGLTISKLEREMNASGYNVGSRQNLYNKLQRQSLRFNEIQDILDFLGYKIEIKRK
ncbi:MAG: hypothetical protein PHE78_00505 [Candidatus Gastranaerophilales bacterium]|nr:hypothetical protein [Candidatus Gastranaerophilales bacterium]